MKNLLVINYRIDSADQVLSHQRGVVRSLSEYFDKIIVLTGYYDGVPVAQNVEIRSTSWDSNHRVRSIIVFYRALFSILANNKISAVFTHMASYRALLASPLFWVKRLSHTVWYAHASFGAHLKLLNIFGALFVSSTPESFPSKRNLPVNFIGQGIKPEEFPFVSREEFHSNKFIHLGRFDISKRIDHMISTLSLLREQNPDLTFTNFGTSSSIANSVYADEIRQGLANQNISDWVSFAPAISRADIAAVLNQYDIFMHAFEGSLDKVLVEATLTGIPVITVNRAYCRIFGTWGECSQKDVSLLQEVQAFSKKTNRQISQILEQRRDIALTEHSENQWVDQITKIVLGLRN